MTEPMNDKPTCRAQLTLYRGGLRPEGGPYDCVLPENHAGPHQDDDGDTWDITYRRPVTLKVRPVQDQLAELTARVGLLEAGRNYVAPADERDGNYLHGRSHDDLIKELYQRLSEVEAARDRQRIGIRDTAERVSALEAGMHPEECHGEQCVKPTVIATQADGTQMMSDGTLGYPYTVGWTGWSSGPCCV